jgi:hypothetical protein
MLGFGIKQMISLAKGKLVEYLEENNNEKEFSLQEINDYLKDHELKILIAIKDEKTIVKIKKVV